VSDYGQDYREIEVRSPAEAKDFSSIFCVQTGSGATHPPVQWVQGVLSPEVKLTLTTHPHLVPRSCMSRSYAFSPPSDSIGVWWDCFAFIPSGLLHMVLYIVNPTTFPQTWFPPYAFRLCMVIISDLFMLVLHLFKDMFQ
jgi:hypothetical protein